MPTGYTAGIEDGTITTAKAFLLICAREFGACIMMRDDPMGSPIQTFIVSEWYQNNVERAEKHLAWLQGLSTDEARVERDKEWKATIDEATKSMREQAEINQRYADILVDVRDWEPPTPDHVGVKDFAIKQINLCIDQDNSFWLKRINKPKVAVGDWMAAKIAEAERQVHSAKKSLAEEKERVEGRNQWVEALRESLG